MGAKGYHVQIKNRIRNMTFILVTLGFFQKNLCILGFFEPRFMELDESVKLDRLDQSIKLDRLDESIKLDRLDRKKSRRIIV